MVDIPDAVAVIDSPPVRVPLFIDYRDVHGKRFETRFTVTCSFSGGWHINLRFDGIELNLKPNPS